MEKYKVDQQVFHLGNNCYGIIKAILKDSGPSGRYEVQEKGLLWSIPGWALQVSKPRKRKLAASSAQDFSKSLSCE